MDFDSSPRILPKRSPSGAPNFTPIVATANRTHLLERLELTGGQAAVSDVLFPHYG